VNLVIALFLLIAVVMGRASNVNPKWGPLVGFATWIGAMVFLTAVKIRYGSEHPRFAQNFIGHHLGYARSMAVMAGGAVLCFLTYARASAMSSVGEAEGAGETRAGPDRAVSG